MHQRDMEKLQLTLHASQLQNVAGLGKVRVLPIVVLQNSEFGQNKYYSSLFIGIDAPTGDIGSICHRHSTGQWTRRDTSRPGQNRR